MVSLVASRQLARLPLAVATQVRQELHALAESAPTLVAKHAGPKPGEPLSMRLLVDRYVAQVSLHPGERIVTLRDVDTGQ
jgi:hypothetical protein